MSSTSTSYSATRRRYIATSAGFSRPRWRSMNQSATRMALRRGHAERAGLQREHVRGAGVERLLHRDRRGHPAVEVAPPADRDGLPARPRHPRGGEQRRPQLLLRAHARRAVSVRAVSTSTATQCSSAPLRDDPLVPGRVEPGGEVEDLLDVDHRLAPDDLHRAHERARRERAPVGGGAALRGAGEERGAVDRAGGRADDEVEARRQLEPLERRRHPGRHDAAHAAALEHERDPVRVRAARPGREPRESPLAQHRGDGVRSFRHRPRP